MQEISTNPGNVGASEPGMADKLSGVGGQAKRKAAELGQMAADKVDATRAGLADTLDTAAAGIHAKADAIPAGAEKVSSVAHTTADAITSSADYLRDHDAKSMVSDFQKLLKNNPGPVLLGAVVLGFLAARAFPRD